MLLDVNGDIQKLKMMKNTFDEHCETGLCTLKFHLLYHTVEDLKRLKAFMC